MANETTVQFTGGDLGPETMAVRCDLSQAAAPVEVDYHTDDGWEATQWQCADCRHTVDGLMQIGKRLAAEAVEVPHEAFACEWEEID